MSGEGRKRGRGGGVGKRGRLHTKHGCFVEGFTPSMDALWKQAPSGTTSYSAS